MGEPGSITISVHLRFMSKQITHLSPVTPQNYIRLNLFIHFVNGNICGSLCFA